MVEVGLRARVKLRVRVGTGWWGSGCLVGFGVLGRVVVVQVADWGRVGQGHMDVRG